MLVRFGDPSPGGGHPLRPRHHHGPDPRGRIFRLDVAFVTLPRQLPGQSLASPLVAEPFMVVCEFNYSLALQAADEIAAASVALAVVSDVLRRPVASPTR